MNQGSEKFFGKSWSYFTARETSGTSRRRNIRLLDVATSRLSFYSVLCNEKRSHLNHQVCE